MSAEEAVVLTTAGSPRVRPETAADAAFLLALFVARAAPALRLSGLRTWRRRARCAPARRSTISPPPRMFARLNFVEGVAEGAADVALVWTAPQPEEGTVKVG